MVVHLVPLKKTISPPCPKEEGRLPMQRGKRGERKQKLSFSMTSDNNGMVMKMLPILVMVHVACCPQSLPMSIYGPPSPLFRPTLPLSFTLIRNHSSSHFFTLPSLSDLQQRFCGSSRLSPF